MGDQRRHRQERPLHLLDDVGATALMYVSNGQVGVRGDVQLQGLLKVKDTHRPRTLRQVYAQEHRTVLGAVRVVKLE